MGLLSFLMYMQKVMLLFVELVLLTKSYTGRWKGESLRESIKRHEHFIALQLGLKPGQKVWFAHSQSHSLLFFLLVSNKKGYVLENKQRGHNPFIENRKESRCKNAKQKSKSWSYPNKMHCKNLISIFFRHPSLVSISYYLTAYFSKLLIYPFW